MAPFPNECSRWYDYSFFPLGLMGRVLVRLLHLADTVAVVTWRNGVLLMHCNDSRTVQLDFQGSPSRSSVCYPSRPATPERQSKQQPKSSNTMTKSLKRMLALRPDSSSKALERGLILFEEEENPFSDAELFGTEPLDPSDPILQSVSQSASIVLVEFDCFANRLKITERYKSKSMLMQPTVATIENLSASINLTPTVHIPCLHCRRKAPFLPPYLFPLASVIRYRSCFALSMSRQGFTSLICSLVGLAGVIDCYSAVKRGELFVYCRDFVAESRCIRIDHLAPDLNLATQVRLLNSDQVQLTAKLGQGGFGLVWKGTWQGRIVAVKELSADSIPVRPLPPLLYSWCDTDSLTHSSRLLNQTESWPSLHLRLCHNRRLP